MKDFHDENLAIDYPLWEDINKFVFNKKHNFIFYNAKTSQFYKNFDLIDITDDDWETIDFLIRNLNSVECPKKWLKYSFEMLFSC